MNNLTLNCDYVIRLGINCSSLGRGADDLVRGHLWILPESNLRRDLGDPLRVGVADSYRDLPKVRLVCGKGTNDSPEPVKVSGKHIPSYVKWQDMLRRTTPKCWSKYPTYTGCEVSVEWLSFITFKTWFDQNHVPGWELDKDLLGNSKLYSSETCVFVPQEINSLFTDHGASRGDLPQGVSRNGRGFRVQCRRGNGMEYFGIYQTPEAAHQKYKEVKLSFCLEQADKWQDDPRLDPRVPDAIRRKARELFT